MNLLKYIWRKRKFIAIVSVLITLIYYGINCFNIYYSERGTISFIYPDSENGRYPDGTRFNIYDLMSDEVLEGTVDIYNERTGRVPIKLSDIENAIVIDEITPYGIQAKVENARSLGQDYSYFANEYRVTIAPIHGVYKRGLNNLFGIIPDVDNKFLAESLYKSYTGYFMNSHAEMNIIPTITQNISYDECDYVEIAKVFETRINMYITYLESKLRENGAYSSEKTGKSFTDLIAEFRNLRDIQVKNLKSFVSSSKLSKNTVEFINKLSVQNESYTLYHNKLADEADAARTAMEEYDNSYVENIVITGQNDEIGLYQARPKTAYDTITKRALDVGVRAQTVLKDIEENNRLINEYTNTVMSSESQARMSSVADRLVREIETESDRLVTVADETISDYLDSRCSDYVRFSFSGKSYFSINLLIRMLIVMIIAMFCSILYLYLVDTDSSLGVRDITDALGIKLTKRKAVVDMLIRLENKMILKRERKHGSKNKGKSESSDGHTDTLPKTKGYIERYIEKLENKRLLKLQQSLEKKEAKQLKNRKKNTRVSHELIFDTAGTEGSKTANVGNSVMQNRLAYLSGIQGGGKSDIQSEINTALKEEIKVEVQPDEIEELISPKSNYEESGEPAAVLAETADMADMAETNAAETASESEISRLEETEFEYEPSAQSDEAEVNGRDDGEEPENEEIYDVYEEDDSCDDSIYDRLYDDYYPEEDSSGDEGELNGTDTETAEPISCDSSNDAAEPKSVNETGSISDKNAADSAHNPNNTDAGAFEVFESNGVLGGMRYKIDEILNSQESIIDEILRAKNVDDLFNDDDSD